MLNASYGKEPFDLRLTVLRTMRNLDKILILTLVGTLFFGGGYYVKNVLLRGEVQYSVTSTYKVEYSDPDWAKNGTYINAVTWNTHVHTKEFRDWVSGRLTKQGAFLTEAEALAGMVTADLPSDLRIPTTTVTAPTPEKCAALAQAVETVMTEEFANATTEIASIRVTDAGISPKELLPDVRPGRAFILSAVLSFFFVTVFFLLKEMGDDGIWLPATIKRRYGIPVLGTVSSRELPENVAYLFRGKSKIAVCGVDGNVNPAEVIEKIQARAAAQTAGQTAAETESAAWIPVPAPLLCPEICESLRGMDGILLAVNAGSHAGKPLEYVLEYLEQQDCKITAAILCDADELLLKSYYWHGGFR